MVTMLALFFLQQMWLCAADCNLGHTNKVLFTSIAFNYLILIFKVNWSAKNTSNLLETCFLSFVSMVTAEDSGTLLFPFGYRKIA